MADNQYDFRLTGRWDERSEDLCYTCYTSGMRYSTLRIP